ncbi:MAG: CotH kinase family protein, partial [Oscillospiraceae bacterium]|nr:CotH kinase family protein [Oscillospiraceae bacterium]
NMFFHNGEMAAVDINSFTIYISQDIDSSTRFNQLVGALRFANPDYKLYFAEDEYFEKLSEAVAQSHPFKLIVTDGGSEYMEYYVIFTNLPLVRMTGAASYTNEENREVYSGDICVWTPFDPQTLGYTVKSSSAQWHVRGDSQKAEPKKPYKFALKNENGANNDLNMLGLGSDDDWILNSMSLEDLEFRDKLVMDIWNEMCADTAYNYPMDSGEYAEVINNGEYSGLYLLQRRVDTKYLNTDRNDVLLKGRKEFADPNNPIYYTVVGDEAAQQQATEIMVQYDAQQNYDRIVLENWIDVNLFVNWGYMSDNVRRHNMYYVLEDMEDDLKIKLILWDTDMTFGLDWSSEGRYVYNLWIMDHLQYNRPEYEKLKEIYPDLDQKLSQRWQQLRSTVLTNENIFAKVESYQQIFIQSGAFARDKAKWGEYHGGADNIEAFYEFIEKRMAFLDSCYGI